MTNRIFHGWWMVAGCLAIAVVAWSFALYGPSVYLYSISQTQGWSIGLISSALTCAFIVNGFALGVVGSLIGRIGPRIVMTAGAALLAVALACIGQATAVWQVYAAFACMALGWSCLSTTAISSTLAPWFDRHQGRAVSTALLGASLGGVVGVPVLLLLIGKLGFGTAMVVVAVLVIAIIWPISLIVMRRHPHDLGLIADGVAPDKVTQAIASRAWTRSQALQTPALRTVTLAFGLALMVQIGFLTHQVTLLRQLLDESTTALTVSCAAALAFAGRLLLAKFSDQVDVRITAAIVLVVACAGLALVSLAQSAWAAVAGILIYGFTAGNITTLSPLIVRREFGAASFGAVFGMTAMLIQFMSAMGPAFYGTLYDLTGGYAIPVGIAALLNLTAALCVLAGRKSAAAILSS